MVINIFELKNTKYFHHGHPSTYLSQKEHVEFTKEMKNYFKKGNCALLGHYAASSGNLLQQSVDSLTVPPAGVEMLDS
jgi:hypothetical protein